jgi:hypothetical protein|nr:MAG TPA: hypothetical protein [Caudoviricetes sp.]
MGQIKKFIGPYQITWTMEDHELEESTGSVHSFLEEDVTVAGEEKTYLNYFPIPPGSDGVDILLERIAYWQNKQ